MVNDGSRVQELQSLVLQRFLLCVTNCISLEMKCITRDLNAEVDFLNGIVVFDDNTLNCVNF